MEKNNAMPQSRKAYTAKEVEAMGFSTEWPKSRLDSFFFKSSPSNRARQQL